MLIDVVSVCQLVRLMSVPDFAIVCIGKCYFFSFP